MMQIEFKKHKYLLTEYQRLFSSFLALESILSATNKNNCKNLLKMQRPINKGNKTITKQAAILVPLCIMNKQLSLLYTVRAPHLKMNGGEVAFPGGIKEETDMTLQSTALREAYEEIGIISHNVEIWERGPDIYSNNLAVTPFLGFIGELNLSNLKLNFNEVSLVFTASLNQLCNSKHFKTTKFRKGLTHVYTTPVYLGSVKRIWGLTAIITHLILSALIPNEYNNNIKFKLNYNKVLGLTKSKIQ